MASEEVKRLLREAALGDEDAIEKVAQLIEGRSEQGRFLEEVDWFEDKFHDVLNHDDPRGNRKARAGQLDAALAARYPNMHPRKRLEKVGEQMERECSDEEDAHHNIQRMARERRARQEGRPVSAADDQEPDPVFDQAEYDRDNETAVQQIKSGRLPRPIPEHLRGDEGLRRTRRG